MGLSRLQDPTNRFKPCNPLLNYFLLQCMMNTTANHQLKLSQQNLGNLSSISYVKMFIRNCGHAKQWARTTDPVCSNWGYM